VELFYVDCFGFEVTAASKADREGAVAFRYSNCSGREQREGRVRGAGERSDGLKRKQTAGFIESSSGRDKKSPVRDQFPGPVDRSPVRKRVMFRDTVDVESGGVGASGDPHSDSLLSSSWSERVHDDLLLSNGDLYLPPLPVPLFPSGRSTAGHSSSGHCRHLGRTISCDRRSGEDGDQWSQEAQDGNPLLKLNLQLRSTTSAATTSDSGDRQKDGERSLGHSRHRRSGHIARDPSPSHDSDTDFTSCHFPYCTETVREYALDEYTFTEDAFGVGGSSNNGSPVVSSVCGRGDAADHLSSSPPSPVSGSEGLDCCSPFVSHVTENMSRCCSIS